MNLENVLSFFVVDGVGEKGSLVHVAEGVGTGAEGGCKQRFEVLPFEGVAIEFGEVDV